MSKIRIATFNVENLFSRARPMNLETWEEGKPILEDIRNLNTELAREKYDEQCKEAIKQILLKYEFDNPNKRARPFDIIQTRKKLFSRPQTGGIKVVAAGRSSWVGWVELQREMFPATAVENTARVLAEVKAQVVCLVEVENRITLHDFNRSVISKFMTPYEHNMVIEGNDMRGIDVGVLSRFPIRSLRSHIDDQAKDDQGRPLFYQNGEPVLIFSRDCPEYEIELPDGQFLYLLANHFKSQGYGSKASNDARRRAQAERVREILTETYDLNQEFVVVAGDLNDTPSQTPLEPLLNTADLHDVLDHLPPGSDRWTYRTGQKQFDYLLASSRLMTTPPGVGIERKGLYSQDDFGGKYSHFPTVKGLTTQASDHAAVWADFSI